MTESFCILCPFTGDTSKVREHQFNEHYEYFLAQCKGNKELVKSLMSWNTKEDSRKEEGKA